MNTKARIVLILALALLAVMALVAMTQAAPGNAPLSQGGAPTVVAYQGEVRVSGDPYTGNGYFKLAVVNAAGDTTYWSNDGSSTGGSEPTAAVQLAVSEGLFGVLLGDTTLGGMTQALTADVFDQTDRYLRVWFSTSGSAFEQLTPDTRIAAVPYALQAQEAANADTLDGLHASELGVDYQNVVIVAKSGGDYTTVQAAIDSVTDAAADNPYLVWVAPGVYDEQVTMKPHVHLQGAGQENTIISSTSSSSTWPPTQATLLLASDTSLRDLTVANSGAADSTVALLATAGTTRTLVRDVTARAVGGGVNYNVAIYLSGSGTGVTLQQVTALAENGSGYNFGLYIYNAAAADVRGGSFTGRDGSYAYGIYNDSSTTLEAQSVTALGENGSTYNYGLYNYDDAATTLRGGSFIGRGGTNAWGICNYGSGTTLEAEGVTALGEDASVNNCGLYNESAAAATLRGGSFTGRGGTYAYGVINSGTSTTLEAQSVTALGESGSSYNYGLYNINAAAATLRGGSFTGRGGTNACGVINAGTSTTLEAQSVTALGESGSSYNYGLSNSGAAAAILRGGSFTGRGGTYARGIETADTSTTLEAESVIVLAENGSSSNYGLSNSGAAAAILRGGSFTGRGGGGAYGIFNWFNSPTLQGEGVTALGEDGSDSNYGLSNSGAAAAILRGGSFTGRGGTYAYGIDNSGSSTTLEAENVTALAEDGSSINYGLYNSGTAMANSSQFTGGSNGVYQTGGTLSLGVSKLDGGATNSGGTLTCFQVYDGSYAGYTCP
jgi:hypothetical protein